MSLAIGYNQIPRENGKRRVVVTRERSRARSRLVRDRCTAARGAEWRFQQATGSSIGGTFEHLQSATNRLAIVVPCTLLLIMACCWSWRSVSIEDAAISFRRAARADRRHRRASAARHPVLDLCGRRLHRTVGHRGAKRSCHGHVHSRSARDRVMASMTQSLRAH